MSAIRVCPEVAEALEAGRAVVALETAVVTTGLPRTPLGRPPRGIDAPGWRDDGPTNLETARLVEREVRDAGAVPATIAVIDGRLRIGLDDADLARLAADASAGRTAAGDLSWHLATGTTAGTTVSASLYGAARLAPRPIRVFATGGIGGVHRGWTGLPDVSADLRELARHRVCTVCAGAKSILDLPATLEALETLGIPVIGFGADRFPQFYAAGTDELRVAKRADAVATVASVCRHHWDDLGIDGGILVARPVPDAVALDPSDLERHIREAEFAADASGAFGRARTPFLLARLAEVTDGRSLDANIALLAENARLGARIAVELA